MYDTILLFQKKLSEICENIYEDIGGYGPEKLYQKALVKELSVAYIDKYNIYEEEIIPLAYKDINYSKRMDITIYTKDDDINPLIILELKWISSNMEPYQLSNYMNLKKCKYGFMINFEKLGSYPQYFIANIFDVNTGEELFLNNTVEEKIGSVKILRFENLN